MQLPEPVEQLQTEEDAEQSNGREIRLSEPKLLHPPGG